MAANLPLRLQHADVQCMKQELAVALDRITASFRRAGHDTSAIEAELTLLLGRACLTYGIEMLNASAANHIDRLEIELDAAAAIVSASMIPDLPRRLPHISPALLDLGSDDREPAVPEVVINGIADPGLTALAITEVQHLVQRSDWGSTVAEYMRGIGYLIVNASGRPGRFRFDVRAT